MKTKKGFTLVELLVVIAIIGLLATIAFISLNSARGKARDAKRVSDVRQVMAALELAYNDNGGYPQDGTIAAGLVAWSGISSAMTNYIGLMPPDVTPNDGGCTSGPTGNNRYLIQSFSADGTTDWPPASGAFSPAYRIQICLGNVTGGLGSGTHVATPNGIQ